MSRCRALSWMPLCLGLACTPELEPIYWEPLDIEALREAVANPTGFVDEATSKEVADAAIEDSDAYRALASYLHEVFVDDPDASPDTAGHPWAIPRASTGTSVFVLVACPGSDIIGGEATFDNGFMRIDSPTITAELVETFGISGQLLLTFSECQIGDYVFEGGGPAYRGTEPSEVAFIPTTTLQYRRLDETELVFDLAEPLLWDPNDRVSALFTLSSGETLTLDWSATTSELHLRGRNGALICEVTLDEFVCTPP